MGECQRCGKCCRHPDNANLQALPEDIERWIQQGRDDILQFVDPFDLPDSDWSSCDIWVNPENGEDFIICPFLQKNDGQDVYTCTIYDTRPYNCRVYFCKKAKRGV